MNNDRSNIASFEHEPTGTAQNGLGAGILLRGENDSDTEFTAARLDGVMTNVATGSETGAMVFETYGAGALAERARFTSAGNLTLAQASTVSTSAGALTVDSAAALDLGTATATAVSLGRAGITTTNNGALTVSANFDRQRQCRRLPARTSPWRSPLVFDGATVDANKTTFAITDPTASRTITFPNASGTVAVSASAPIAIDAAGNITCSTCTTTAVTLQNAYNGGQTITTSSSHDIALTLTSGNLTASGAGSVNLTPTAASQFTSANALTLTGGAASTWSTSSGGLTITSAAAATWSTTAGNLTIQAGSGTVTLGSSTTLTAAGALTIDSNTTNALNFGNGGNAKTITIGNNTTTTALNITSGTGAQTFTSSNATGATTASSFVFSDAALSSGTLLRLTSSSTSGKLADLNFSNTTGTIMNGAYGAGTTQGAGALIGLEWDMNANLTAPAAGQNVTGIDLKMPAASTTSGAAAYNGFNLTTAGAITNATAGRSPARRERDHPEHHAKRGRVGHRQRPHGQYRHDHHRRHGERG